MRTARLKSKTGHCSKPTKKSKVGIFLADKYLLGQQRHETILWNRTLGQTSVKRSPMCLERTSMFCRAASLNRKSTPTSRYQN